jgi:thiamine biosynthesis lipoprotein
MTKRNTAGYFIQQFLIICLSLCAGMEFAACAKTPPEQMEFAFGTVCKINLYEFGSKKLYASVFSRLREIDNAMSARESAGAPSILMQINNNAGIAPVKIPDDLLEVLEQAKRYAKLSHGAFDPTVGPLVNLWGIGTEDQKIPAAREIAERLALIDWQDLIVDRHEGTAFLKRKGMALDLGAIAKGYAADEAARIAKEGGASRAIIDLGGNVMAIGGRRHIWRQEQGNTAWRVGVQNPQEERGAYIGVLLAQDKAVVTSGVYERFFEAEGTRYHHIFSTIDGYPVDNGLLSVTIVADRSIDADALSTAVFALGYEQGMALLETVPNAQAIFVFEDSSVKISGGLRETFNLTDGRYAIQ